MPKTSLKKQKAPLSKARSKLKKKNRKQQETSMASTYFGSVSAMMRYISRICAGLFHIFIVNKAKKK